MVSQAQKENNVYFHYRHVGNRVVTKCGPIDVYEEDKKETTFEEIDESEHIV